MNGPVVKTPAPSSPTRGSSRSEIPHEWLHQIQHTAFFDIRELFDANGSIKDLSQIGPEHLLAIAGMEVFEEFSGTGGQRQRSA
jgi:hypothetical protein